MLNIVRYILAAIPYIGIGIAIGLVALAVSSAIAP